MYMFDAFVYHLFRNVGSLACLAQIAVRSFSVSQFVYIFFFSPLSATDVLYPMKTPTVKVLRIHFTCTSVII